MVGEIRDGETAEIAVRAAITGHLVLSTIHTNDAISSVVRLKDMGIEPYLISSSLVGVVAQRLIRRLCPHCKEKYEASNYEKEILNIDKDESLTLYRKTGCTRCSETGYKG
ncbi:Flp pilus assembly complex ATPase component TadA, partial [Clostridium saudiense]|nr:Flp pilus assembly complex ATPase component TadA [Clostridium saudiense]